MTPIEFPQQTDILAKDQPEYLNLPCYLDDIEFISCWSLTVWERLLLLFTGRVWIRQLHFGSQPQAQRPQVESPFPPPPEPPHEVMPSGRSPRRGTYITRSDR